MSMGVSVDKTGFQPEDNSLWQDLCRYCMYPNDSSVTLTGTDGLGNAVNLMTTTDAAGDYSFTGVLPGTYTITIQDIHGCTDTGTATVEATPTPEISAVVVDTECGLNTGSITASATMGIEPYTYALDNGPFGTGNVFSDLPAGTYFTRTDSTGFFDKLWGDIPCVQDNCNVMLGTPILVTKDSITQVDFELEGSGGLIYFDDFESLD